MTITNERLRELAAYSSDPRANLHHHLAAELLAAREQLACKGCGGSVGDHLTPDQGGCPARFEIDGIHMVPAALLDAAAGRAAAMAAEVRRLERANVVDRDNATAWEAMANARLKERDAARAEVERLQAAARAMGWTCSAEGFWRDVDGAWKDRETDGPEPAEREMLAHLHKTGIVNTASSRKVCEVQHMSTPEMTMTPREGPEWIRGRDLREALARLVVAVKEREEAK